MKLLLIIFILTTGSGCAIYRVENPKILAPVHDSTRAEIVGWKTRVSTTNGPDRVVPLEIDRRKLNDESLDFSETIHPIDTGNHLIKVMYFGGRGNILPKYFTAYSEILLSAEAGVRYQCQGKVEGDSVILWMVRLPEGTVVTSRKEAMIGDLSLSGTIKPRG